ncbi:ATP-grasp domain-containing protein [Mariniblastus fucicola]|uniref:Uncharacterized protein n=1 Tax=Mariniblastus fucicola TaxID=980251 RepID=A0A5B9PGS0_9BACT|nr:hypothetical protein [Mariniblastus fucicola]QEG23796.1 hypothetical protein MFFC18_37000 [Mariniblastus fucicola]
MLTEPKLIEPGNFETEEHFYPRVLNAHIHPLIHNLMDMGNDRIASRYCHLHPEVDPESVRNLLATVPRYFRWGGCDLFHVTTETGLRQVVVIETNSCPSGQKSMPRLNESIEKAGYDRLLRDSFLEQVGRRKGGPKGDFAVIYDKNHMETSGYASALADLTGDKVWLVPFHENDAGRTVSFDEKGLMHVHHNGEKVPIKAAFRYVTQQPWNRIPIHLTRTLIYNPVLICLSGGRNKLVASKAYDLYNASRQNSGLKIHTPETIWDVSKEEVPMWVQRMGGVAVVKVPYSNAGQGVYTITSAEELDAFMQLNHGYDHYIVQSLIGNSRWSSQSQFGRLFHVGTMPDRKLNLYAADLRFMVGASPKGFFPVAIYARRARKPLTTDLKHGDDSWDMLGTNLSVKNEDGTFSTQPERLLLVDSRDFNRLGFGLDDLIESYMQTVMCIVAIDDMAKSLVNTKGKFRKKLFQSINPDRRFNEEIMF